MSMMPFREAVFLLLAAAVVPSTLAQRQEGSETPNINAPSSTPAGSADVLKQASQDLRDHTFGWVNVRSSGAKGTGTDDTRALAVAVAALPATDGTLYFPPGSYNETTPLVINKPRTHIVGRGATLTQTGANQRGLFVTGASGVMIEGLSVVSARGPSDWKGNSRTDSIGIYIDKSNDSVITNTRVENWGSEGIVIYQSSNTDVRNNTIIGIGSRGGLVAGSNYNVGIRYYYDGAAYPDHRLTGNHFRDLTQGIVFDNVWKNIVIANNMFSNIIGQHGLYAGALQNAAVVGNVINGCGQIGLKFQTTEHSTDNGRNITVADNSIAHCGQAGILFLQASGNRRFLGVSLTSNTITDCGYGLDVQSSDDFVVANNVVINASGYGLLLKDVGHGRVGGNLVDTSQWSGIHVGARPQSVILISDNLLVDPARRAGDTDPAKNSGIYLSGGDFLLRDNAIRANSAPYQWNVFADASTTVSPLGNRFPNTKPNRYGSDSTAPLFEFEGNLGSGSANVVSLKGAELQGYARVGVNGKLYLVPLYDAPQKP